MTMLMITLIACWDILIYLLTVVRRFLRNCIAISEPARFIWAIYKWNKRQFKIKVSSKPWQLLKKKKKEGNAQRTCRAKDQVSLHLEARGLCP